MYNQSYDDYIRSILGYPIESNNIYAGNDYDEIFQSRNNYINNGYYNPSYYMNYSGMERASNQQLEQYYPEIYKIVYPMIKKACNSRNNVLSEEEIEKIVDEIYNALEPSNVETVGLNINLTNDVGNSNQNNRGTITGQNSRGNSSTVSMQNSGGSNNTGATQNSGTSNNTSTAQSRNVSNTANFVDSNISGTNNSKSESRSNNEKEKNQESREDRVVRNNTLRDLIKILLLRELIGRPGRPGRPPYPGGNAGGGPRPPYPGGNVGGGPRPPYPGGNVGGPRPPYPGGNMGGGSRPPMPRAEIYDRYSLSNFGDEFEI